MNSRQRLLTTLAHRQPDRVPYDLALMPGGGYVFNTVHNIQAEVPPENIMAMWETLREVGEY